MRQFKTESYINNLSKKAISFRVNTAKLEVDSIQFYHEKMNFRLLASTDICANTSNDVTLQLADTCFYVHIDTVIVHDSIFHHFFDTTVITRWDTGYVQVYDTITTKYYDTIWVKVNYYDTTRVNVNVYDTTFITVQDTLHFSIPLSGSSPLILSNIEIYPNPTYPPEQLHVFIYRSSSAAIDRAA